MRINKQFAIGAATLLAVQSASAIDLTLNGGVELEWTDNALRANENRRHDLLETVRAGVVANESESWYQLNLGYEVSYERYERDSFDAETYYNGTGSLMLIPIPDRFDWLFSVQSTTTQTRSVLPDTPDNRDQRNVYSTSPRLQLLSLSRDTVSLSAHATKVEFRDSDDSESDRFGGTLNWTHLLSQLTSSNVVVGQEEARFDLEQDYTREYYTLGLTRQINGGSVSVSTGQTRIKPDEGDEFDGVNFRGSINWSNATHSLLFEAIRDLTDTSTGFLDVTEGSQDYLSPSELNTGQVDLVTRTMVSFSDTYAVSSTMSLYGAIYADREKTETSEYESRRVGTTLRFSRSLNPQLSATAECRFEKALEGEEEIEDKTTIIALGLNQRFGERLILRGWVEREESDNEIDDLGYEVHTVGASLTAQF